MNGLLLRIVRSKVEEVAARRREVPLELLPRPDRGPAPRFRDALRDAAGGGRPACIAEIKRRSPSAGPLRAGADPAVLARAYERAGATALSVLTDGPWFGGSDSDLVAAREAARLPLLRKDFTVDAYQVHEARALGADAVLLIVRILGPRRLSALLRAAEDAGLDALVEVHDDADLKMALDRDATLIGINSRDLDTFEIDFERALSLRASVPDDRVTVAESGIRTADDVARANAAGFDAVLVGEALMRAPDPGDALDGLLRRGR